MALIASGCATQVQCTVETTGVEHSTQLREALGDAGCAADIDLPPAPLAGPPDSHMDCHQTRWP